MTVLSAPKSVGAGAHGRPSVERVTIKIMAKTDTKVSEYAPHALYGFEINQSFAFNPTNESLLWNTGGVGRTYPGFAIPVPGGYHDVPINNDWAVEATIELK